MKYNEKNDESQGGDMIRVFKVGEYKIVIELDGGEMKYYFVNNDDVITRETVEFCLSKSELIDLKCHEEELIMDANDGRTSSETRK